MKGISIGPEMVHMGDLATKHEIDFFTNPIDNRKQTEGSMPELKPCPFCGGEAKVQVYNEWTHFSIDCKRCPASIGKDIYRNGFAKKCEAIAAWNNRQGKTE